MSQSFISMPHATSLVLPFSLWLILLLRVVFLRMHLDQNNDLLTITLLSASHDAVGIIAWGELRLPLLSIVGWTSDNALLLLVLKLRVWRFRQPGLR
jgi:hypothetical protein